MGESAFTSTHSHTGVPTPNTNWPMGTTSSVEHRRRHGRWPTTWRSHGGPQGMIASWHALSHETTDPRSHALGRELEWWLASAVEEHCRPRTHAVPRPVQTHWGHAAWLNSYCETHMACGMKRGQSHQPDTEPGAKQPKLWGAADPFDNTGAGMRDLTLPGGDDDDSQMYTISGPAVPSDGLVRGIGHRAENELAASLREAEREMTRLAEENNALDEQQRLSRATIARQAHRHHVRAARRVPPPPLQAQDALYFPPQPDNMDDCKMEDEA